MADRLAEGPTRKARETDPTTGREDRTEAMILGVDIGVTGGISLLEENGVLIETFVMPCLADGPKRAKTGVPRKTVNAPLLAELVYKSHARIAFVERVGPRPGEGSVSAFAFGDCKGVVRGVLAAAAIPTVFITPVQWKKVVGVPPGKDGAKDAARAEAIRRWPAKAGFFRLKNTDGLAESALIGLAGLMAFDDKPNPGFVGKANFVVISDGQRHDGAGNKGAEKGAA
jgi:crossover junction endodeoxyribonuclease RuvC